MSIKINKDMKSLNFLVITFFIIAFSVMISAQAYCQNESREVLRKAMKDEIDRSANELMLENLKSPFFISYSVYDMKTTAIKATLGSITTSTHQHSRPHSVRVLVGDYKRTQENFIDNLYGSWMRGSMPLGDDYEGVRRALWISTDNVYKSATESYERKVSAIDQQNLTEEELSTYDFSKLQSVNLTLPMRNLDFDKTYWENTARELSILFTDYSEIFSSNTSVFLLQVDGFFINTEGVETNFPMTVIAVLVNAYTQAEDGEPLIDHVLYYGLTKKDMPDLDKMKKDVRLMADNLNALRKAPVFDDSYSGPIIFENDAVGELFAKRLFSGASGLIAIRKSLYADPNAMRFRRPQGESLEKKIGRKIISNEFDIIATPKLKSFGSKGLIGSYEIDAEGVIPNDNIVLVEKGILKTLLNGRTPTPKVKESNGHSRLSIQGNYISRDLGPSVINISTSKGLPYEKLKKKLLESAKGEGLDYALIIRKLQTSNPGMDSKMNEIIKAVAGSKEGIMSKPIYIYKVSVKDGKEELVRSTELSKISISSMKRILGATKKQSVYNTLIEKQRGGFYYSPPGRLKGIPASLVVPQAILFEEVDVEKEKRAITTKLPIVQNPVGKDKK